MVDARVAEDFVDGLGDGPRVRQREHHDARMDRSRSKRRCREGFRERLLLRCTLFDLIEQ